MLSLPPEIQTLVLSPCRCLEPSCQEPHRTSKIYTRLRLVCRLFNEIITPFVFETLFISSDECSLIRLQNIAKEPRINYLVKTYAFKLSSIPKGSINIQSVLNKDKYCQLLAVPHLRNDILNTGLGEHEGIQLLETLYKHITFELSGTLSYIHAKYLPILQNLRTIWLDTDCCILSDCPYDGGNWGRVVLVGIIDALYRRTQITGIPKVTELVVSRLDSKTMLLSPQIIEKATKGMAQLQTVRITLSVDVIGDKWIFLVGRLLGAVRGLRHMSISSSSYYIKWVNLWDLLLPFEYYYHCSLKAAHVTMVMLRRWEVLQVVTLFGVVSWADLLISFFEKHKTTLRSFELIGCQLIDGYDGRLEDLHQEVGGVPQPFIWRWFFLSFKARTAPLMLEKLVFGDLSTGYPTPRRFAIHNGEATLWTEWVMGRKASEPFPGERPVSGCPRRCLLCEDEINEGLPEVSNA